MSIYNEIYNLINLYVFNGTIEIGSYPDLVTTLFSTTACFLMVSLPFIIVFMILRFVLSK